MIHHAHDEDAEHDEAGSHEPVSIHRGHHRPGFIKRLIIALIINTGALLAVLYVVEGISFADDVTTFRLQLRAIIITGLLMGLANGIVKPILKFFTFPLILLSLGLLMVIINLFVFWLVLDNTSGLVVTGGFSAYFWGSIIFSIVNTVEHWIIRSFTS